ncbi:MAG: ABC transporter substrate-binding protein [Bacilli bacterium]
MKNYVKIILVLVLSFGLWACQSKETTSKMDKDTLIMAIESDPGANINPVTTNDRFGLMVVNAVYSPLYTYYGPEDINFKLGKEIDISEDGLIYTITLKEDLKWHDGKDITVDDVIFTFETLLNNPSSELNTPLQFGGTPVVVSKGDANNVIFTLSSPRSNALEVFSKAYIMPKHIYEQVSDYATSSITPVGSGPYMYNKYSEGESTTFKAFDQYFDGEAIIENLVFRVILDPNAAIIALQKNEVNALAVLPADVSKLDEKKIDINAYSEGRLGYLSFNFNTTKNKELVNNSELRKAVFYAINKEDIIKASYVSSEYSLNPVSFLPSIATYSSNDVTPYGLDLVKAKEHLSKANIKDETLILGYSDTPVYKAQATIIQANLKEAGIKLELQAVDPTALFKSLMDKNAAFDLYLGGYIMTIDPDGYAPLFTSNNKINYSGISNSKIDELFKQGINETDDSKRAAIYLELQQVFADESFFLPLSENKRVLATNNAIDGIEAARLVGIYTFEDWSKLSIK